MKKLRKIEDSHFIENKNKDNSQSVQSLILEDQSTLIYQSYDSVQYRFFDTYWINSIDDIYRIKYLIINPMNSNNHPIGKFVDHFVRNSEGQIVQIESFESMIFPAIRFNKQNFAETLMPVYDQSLSKLQKQLPGKNEPLSEKKARILTVYYRKLVMPWLCFLAIIAPAPFCFKFDRNLSVFFIYTISMFGLVSLYLILNAAVIIGQSQVVHPFWAIWPCFTLISAYFGWKFFRLHRA
jgi:lipopolysaccharide export system permease protein